MPSTRERRRRSRGTARGQGPAHALLHARGHRPCGRRNQLRGGKGEDARDRRRVRLRQVGDGALDHGPDPEAPGGDRLRRGALRGPRPDQALRASAGGHPRPRDRDDLPGPDDVAQSDADDRDADHRDDQAPLRRAAEAGEQEGDRADGGGADPTCLGAARGLPAPLLGRHAAARDDRDRALLRSEAADRRRADDGARRDRAGLRARPARRPPAGARDGDDHHHPRHGRRRRGSRRHPRHVRGPGGRAGHDARPLRQPGASLHRGVARCAAAARGRRDSPGTADRDPGAPAGPDRPAAGVPVRAALPLRGRRLVHRGDARAARAAQGPLGAVGPSGKRARRARGCPHDGDPRGHEPGQALPDPVRPAVRAHGRRDRRGQRDQLRDRGGGDARPRRRVGLRQVDRRLLHPPAAEADVRLGALRGDGADGRSAARRCARCGARCRSSSRIRTRRSTRG